MITNLTFGSDPEYFVKNEVTGMIVSSIPVVDGTKGEPEALGDGYFILKDNILVEGNIPPARTRGEFISNMLELKNRINGYMKAKYPVLGVHHDDCLELDSRFLTNPEALEFGCSPYLNAWDDEIHRANDLSKENFRTAGFHVHIGYDISPEYVWSRETISSMIARAYDLFVIIPSCMVHVDRRRFENYGGLGQYRNTSYGLECRSLGAFFANDKYLGWVFDQTMKAIDFVSKEENMYKLMYMAKPEAKFKSSLFTYESSVYKDRGIEEKEQLIP